MRILVLLLSLIAYSFSAEVAVTGSGRKVLLKNDGTWEPYDEAKHLSFRDLRESGPTVQYSVKYKDHGWILKETRTMLEAEDMPEKSIQDSLRRLPKGGLLHLQVADMQIDTADPRSFQVVITDARGKILLRTKASESTATDSDDAGIKDVAIFAIPTAPKGGALKLTLEEKATRQTYEFDIPITATEP